MWSAGICLYLMLFGSLPFKGSSMYELHQAIQNGKYEIPDENLSKEGRDLLAKLIQTNPKKRFSAEECL